MESKKKDNYWVEKEAATIQNRKRKNNEREKKILFTKDLEIKCIMICSQWTEALVSITGIARVRWH